MLCITLFCGIKGVRHRHCDGEGAIVVGGEVDPQPVIAAAHAEQEGRDRAGLDDPVVTGLHRGRVDRIAVAGRSRLVRKREDHVGAVHLHVGRQHTDDLGGVDGLVSRAIRSGGVDDLVLRELVERVLDGRSATTSSRP